MFVFIFITNISMKNNIRTKILYVVKSYTELVYTVHTIYRLLFMNFKRLKQLF